MEHQYLGADAVAKRYRPWPKGLRADSLPWFDSPLGASRLRYTDKAQMQRPGHTGRKALATKRSTNIWETWPVIEGHNFKEDWDKEGHINHPKRSETVLTTDDIHQLQQPSL